MSKNKTFICAKCKSHDVVRDAWVEWDIEEQQWVLQNWFDAAYCNDCDKECSLEEIEIPD